MVDSYGLVQILVVIRHMETNTGGGSGGYGGVEMDPKDKVEGGWTVLTTSKLKGQNTKRRPNPPSNYIHLKALLTSRDQIIVLVQDSWNRKMSNIMGQRAGDLSDKMKSLKWIGDELAIERN